MMVECLNLKKEIVRRGNNREKRREIEATHTDTG